MNHDEILASMSPAMRDVMQRVREVGLHKVAAQIHNQPEFTLKVAAQVLGTELMRQHYKFSKVAAGIRALQALDQTGEITLEKTAAPPIPAAAMRAGKNPFAMPKGAVSPFAGKGPKPKPRTPLPEAPGGISENIDVAMRNSGVPPGVSRDTFARFLTKGAQLATLDFAKMANMFRLGTKGVESLTPAARRAMPEAGHAMNTVAPGFFEGALGAGKAGGGSADMFAQFSPEMMSAAAKKQTIRGAQLPMELPPMGRLPTKMGSEKKK